MLRQLQTGRKLTTTLCFLSLAALAILSMMRGGQLASAAPAAIAAALPRPRIRAPKAS